MSVDDAQADGPHDEDAQADGPQAEDEQADGEHDQGQEDEGGEEDAQGDEADAAREDEVNNTDDMDIDKPTPRPSQKGQPRKARYSGEHINYAD
jgi:hypothetical protein